MQSPEHIHSLWTQRQKAMGPVLAAGSTLRHIYNGDYNLALPELNKNEQSAVANLIQMGVDQHAMRIASVLPTIICPPTRAGAVAQSRADDRRKTLLCWHHQSGMKRKLRRRARHLIGYATTPVLIRPSNRGIPVWELRDPLATFPAPCDPDELVPENCIFSYKQSLGWIRANYPEALADFSEGPRATSDTMYTCLEYIDSDCHCLIAIGKDGYGHDSTPTLLYYTENRAGRPLVIVPGRITLDRLQGQFDQMVGMYETQAQLWALQIHAVKRGIFAETWIESPDGVTADVTAVADPYTGDIGQVSGGALKQFRVDPGYQTLPAIDRMERAQRIVGAVPAEMGGEGATNVRTARRGGQVLSAAVDFFIQEHQELLAASMEEENRAAIAIAKAYWGDTPRTFQLPGLRSYVSYTPSVTFDTDANYVSYAYAGTDTNGLVIEMGQRIGMGTLSKQSFMDIDPAIHDSDAERDKIMVEALEQATISGLQAMAAAPDSPFQPADWARLSELVIEKNLPLYKAIAKVQEEAQERQAAAQQGQLSPEAMQPGLAPVGAPGTPGAGEAIPEPGPSMGNLNSLLMQLRGPQMTMPSERAG